MTVATETAELLRRYAATGCEIAFRELVKLHASLVYSTALRRVGGEVHLAQDVAQTVFCDLARKASSLPGDVVLAGWLYRHTCLKTAEAVRAENRRRLREHLATETHNMDQPDDSIWREVAPVLDEGMQRLNPADRDALILRYFQNASLRAIGQALGVSEDAAQKRVTRALDKMREQFARQGIACTVAALSSTLASHGTPALADGVGAALSTAALTAAASGAAQTTYATTVLQLMASTKLKITVAALVVASFTTPLILQHHALNRWRAENGDLRQILASSAQPAVAPAVSNEDEVARLGAEHDELLRLRGQVNLLQRERGETLRKMLASVASTNRPGAASRQQMDAAWVQQVLDSPPAVQGSIAGTLRGRLLRKQMDAVTASEMSLREALLQRQLNDSLEHSPADFADFQSAFIQSAIGITDAARTEQIRQLTRQTYEQAVAQGLDVPSKPATDTESWVQRRHQLDRQATAAIRNLLSPEERLLFDRAFLGIMGVDLGGIGVDKSNYPPGFLGPE